MNRCKKRWKLFARPSNGVLANAVKQVMKLPYPVTRRCWRSPRFRRALRKLEKRVDYVFYEHAAGTLMLCAQERVHIGRALFLTCECGCVCSGG